jgi:hypothetical protein
MQWDVHAAVWDENYDLVLTYQAGTGKRQIPMNATWPIGDPEGCKIGIWWSRQRKNYIAGQLSPDRITKLEAIGMVFTEKADKENIDLDQ